MAGMSVQYDKGIFVCICNLFGMILCGFVHRAWDNDVWICVEKVFQLNLSDTI